MNYMGNIHTGFLTAYIQRKLAFIEINVTVLVHVYTFQYM